MLNKIKNKISKMGAVKFSPLQFQNWEYLEN